MSAEIIDITARMRWKNSTVGDVRKKIMELAQIHAQEIHHTAIMNPLWAEDNYEALRDIAGELCGAIFIAELRMKRKESTHV